MSVFLATGKNLMLDHLASLIDEVSLHDDDPGTAGDNELTGGSPAYARLAPDFDAASGGEVALLYDMLFDVPASSTVAWIGFWYDGTLVGKGELAEAEAFAAQGTFTLTTATKLKIIDPA